MLNTQADRNQIVLKQHTEQISSAYQFVLGSIGFRRKNCLCIEHKYIHLHLQTVLPVLKSPRHSNVSRLNLRH